MPYLKILIDQQSPNPIFLHYLGYYYDQGLGGVEKSYSQALKFYKLGADQGVPVSQYSVGYYLEKGLGELKISYQDALKYYQLSADQNYAPAQYWLGKIYFEGKIVEKSIEKALKYCQLAADQGYIKAQLTLGKYYKQKKSNAKACKYYQLAADLGDKEAQYMVGEFYRKGALDLKESWETALGYYKLAANQGHLQAIKFLFDCFHYGKKVQESQEEALKYLRMGVKLNDLECQFLLGEYYAHGRGGLPSSVLEATKYYKLAALQGHQQATRILANVKLFLGTQT